MRPAALANDEATSRADSTDEALLAHAELARLDREWEVELRALLVRERGGGRVPRVWVGGLALGLGMLAPALLLVAPLLRGLVEALGIAVLALSLMGVGLWEIRRARRYDAAFDRYAARRRVLTERIDGSSQRRR